MGWERREEHRRWATVPPAPGIQYNVSEIFLIGFAGRGVEVGFILLLPRVHGIGDEAHTRVGREAGRAERRQPLPRNGARHQPIGRRNIGADSERHATDL